MAAYEFTGAKWNGTTLGAPGGQVTWSFGAVAGNFYSFDAPISQPIYQNLIRDAFQAWENVANIDFVEVAASASTQIQLGWDSIDGRSNTLAEAGYSFYPGGQFNELAEAGIRFDTAEGWGTTKSFVAGVTNFFAVALHEIGHALGLDHTDDTNTIMYPSIGTRVELTPGDIAGAEALYGSKSSGNPTPPPTPTPPAPGNFGGTNGDDVYLGTSGGDTMFGLGGNDRFTGGGGNDRIDGGAGLDFALFGGAHEQYGVTTFGANGVDVVDLSASSPDGSDSLTGVERLGFDDGTLAFDLGGTAGQAYRLYQAAFDREPDVEGLGFWIRQLDAGRGDLVWVADQFQHSEEFQKTYGAPAELSNGQFLNLLYNNVLDRTPDMNGYMYWMGRLGDAYGRDRVLVDFSESQENVAKTAAAVEDGIWYV
ncbi:MULTISPECIES: DUF4214 domain-containing protein [unclassified Devosia]|uniref:DUF4214 domain-containing protein n=1 Tax=unclassified Devosia TaxID=196773 RepID=UPI001554DF06|nr:MULTISPECIES: DUF4214 domain-containing protein [unclassified Devosia]